MDTSYDNLIIRPMSSSEQWLVTISVFSAHDHNKLPVDIQSCILPETISSLHIYTRR
jgi:hypothetical protein